MTEATSGDNGGEEPIHLGDLFATYRWVAEAIADGVPELVQVQDRLLDAIRPLNLVVHEQMDKTDPVQRARGRIVLQATNDFLDVFSEAMWGRGRPAVRSARTLFEHAVNHRWVTADPAEAERYLDQVAVTEKLDLDLNTASEEEFTGAMRKRFRHWKAKLEREIVPRYNAVIRSYGPGFRRAWATRDLRARAAAHDLDDEYDNYRLLSAVIHGSAGGDLGHRRESQGQTPVLRTGPALAACPLALRLGHRYYRLLLEDVAAAVGTEATARMLDVLAVVDDGLSAHRDVCHGLDSTIWPEGPIPTLLYLKVTVEGDWIWILRDTERDVTIWAEPTIDQDRMAGLAERVRQVETANPGRTRSLFILVPGGGGTPRPGARWLPAGDTLRPRDLGFGPRPRAGWTWVDAPGHDPSLYD